MLPVALCQFRFPIVGRAATKTRLPGRQAWMMMKLTLILLTAFCVQLSAKGFSQGITISEKEASLEKVINEISRQSGYNIFYTESILQQAKKITIDVTNVSLTEALDLCFKDQPLTYTITGKTIIIKQKPEPKKKDEQPTVIPPIDIKGKIVNEKGQPIAGASVAVKGTDKGTSTDENGEFILTAVDPNATLLISGVNIESFEWKLKGRSNLGDISAITKIVVGEGVSVKANTGYEAVDPTRRPGSYVVIGNDLLNRTVSTDILSRLNGNAPGLLFNGGSASLGYLNIRSRSTIFGKTSPLIVVDNFPYYGDILSINPNDVESITILKDAAAGSIWGMMASNGVIVITTKTGRYNQPIQVSINSNVTISEKMDFFSSPQMSTEDFIEVEKFLFNKGYYDAAINSSSRPALTPVVEVLLKKRNGQLSDAVATSQIENLKSLDLRYDKNKYFFQRPVSQQYSVNLSGGSVNQRYYLSVGWDKNLRPKTGNEFTRLSINANNSYKLIKDRLEITSGIIYNQNNSEINSAGVPVGYPYARLADEFGNSLPIARYRQGYIDTAGAGKLLDWNYYPLEELNLSDHTIKGTGYQINTAAKYNIIEGLDVALTFQYRKEILEDRDLKNLETFFTRDYINSFSSINWANGTVTRPVPLGGILDVISSQSTFKNFRSQINYSHSWPNQHDVTALIGGEISEAITNNTTNRLYGYDDDRASDLAVDYVNSYKDYITGNAATINRNSDIKSLNSRNVSAFFNAAYTYKKRYTVSASARKDASNILGVETNQKWVPLWSIGGSWDISRESFYQINWLPKLKLRGSYGFQGNVDNSLSALLTIRQTTPDRWNLPSATIANSPNPDLRWEKTGVLNIAVDFSMLNSAISGTFEYYRKKSVDLIGTIPLAPSLGVATFKGNTSDMKSEGLDFSIETRNLNGALKWYTSFWFSHTKDRVTDYKTKLTNISGYVESSDINPVVGNPVRSLYSYKWAGLDPATGDPQGYVNKVVSKDYAGIFAISDLNEMVYNGPLVAPNFGALRNTLEWKSFSFSFNIIYKFGHYFRRASINYDRLFTKGTFGNKDYDYRWQKAGDELITGVPSLIYPSNPSRDRFYRYSETLVEKADHIRLQDIRLSYDLHKAFLTQKLGIGNIQIYAVASNLDILWRANKSKLDPDMVQADDTIDQQKMISTGLKIDF